MFLRSDNIAGVDPHILAAINACNEGSAEPYGGDPLSAKLDSEFAVLFGAPVRVFPVTSGTAANSLALAAVAGPFDLIACHAAAHAFGNECGATETMSGGARFLPIAGGDGRMDVDATTSALANAQRAGASGYRPTALSVTQLTEAGTTYGIEHLRALGALAHELGLRFHMDGARFANALASLQVTPADLTWRLGVDVLSFGGTKNGTMCADAVVFFDLTAAANFERRLKRAGQALSKSRFLAAQLLRYIEGGLWLRNARHANAMALQLADALSRVAGVRVTHPVQGNIVFAELAGDIIPALAQHGIRLRVKSFREDGTGFVRFVTSFATQSVEIAAFAEHLDQRASL
jgi:threonine aldolase